MSIAESVLWAGFKALRTERRWSTRDGEEQLGEHVFCLSAGLIMAATFFISYASLG